MKNQIKTIFLLGTLSVLLIFVGSLMGKMTFYLFTLFAIGINLVSYFFSDRIVLRLYGARELEAHEMPALHRMVEELAICAEIPKPKVCWIDDPQPNAFATGRNPEKGVVAVTSGIFNLLSSRELRGVLAHEIAHIKNRDILLSTIAAAIATALTYLANAMSFQSLFGSHSSSSDSSEEGSSPLGGILLAVVAPIAATLLQLGVSRSREYLADETGAKISKDPEALALALDKLQHSAEVIPSAHAEPATASLFIVNPFSYQRVSGWFSTHPPMEERIHRLRQMASDGSFLISDR